jgi:hypothetical protein
MSELRFKKDHSFDGWPTKDTLTGMHLNLDSSRDTLNCQDSVINKLKSDNKLLREYMLFIAKETDNETLSLAGVNQAANNALAATKDLTC